MADSQADTPTSELDLGHVGHVWDTMQPPIESTIVTAGHRRKTDLSRGGLTKK